MDPEFTQKPVLAQPNQARKAHRRTQSETFFRFSELDDDILLNDVVSDFNLLHPPRQQIPPNQNDGLNQIYSSLSVDATSANTQSLPPRQQTPETRNDGMKSIYRSLSVDATSANTLMIQPPRQPIPGNQNFELDAIYQSSVAATSANTQAVQPPRQLIPENPADELNPIYQLSHYRSLSVDADFFAGLDIGGASWNSLAESAEEAEEGEGGRRIRHRRSNSIDGSSSASSYEAVDASKKAMAPERLAELAVSDPLKAKRILANRQSAARSKERKVRYTSELERKVQTLQVETTTLSTQVTKMQRDTAGLTTENKELSLRLEALEQQSHLRDALNEALKEELKHLKIVSGEIQVVNGNGSLYYNQPHAFNGFRGSQPQYAQQTQQQKQQQPVHVPCPTDVDPNLSRQPQPNFQGFNQRV